MHAQFSQQLSQLKQGFTFTLALGFNYARYIVYVHA